MPTAYEHFIVATDEVLETLPELPAPFRGDPAEGGLSPAALADISSWVTDESLLESYGGHGFRAIQVAGPPPPLVATLLKVNMERDARIDGGFKHTVDGVEYTFQSAPSDRENVMGMAMAAGAALSAMAAADPPVNPVGNLRWFNPAADFKWITADNTLCPMDAIQTQALFAAGAAFKAGCTFTARAYKDAMIVDGTDAGADAIFQTIVWPA